ncbi:MAG: NUDIX hydrolase [Trueperaceae bacterium]|nr:NUDIX hydrolase [Trueperaceae bacterium]HNQ98638.1 NUDIX hydrolase [Trueperaceae bacterium]
MALNFETRVAAYGLIVDQGRLLLAHFSVPGLAPGWTLPGGGLEFGEDPATAAVREVFEETGYHVELTGLLGTDSVHMRPEQRSRPGDLPLHSFRLIYAARLVSGMLRSEADGSTDEARWFEFDEVTDLERVPLVDIGLRLWRERRGGHPR